MLKVLGVVAAALVVYVLWVARLVTTTQSLDIYSGRERVVTTWVLLDVEEKLVDTDFYLRAKRMGLVTREPEWHVFLIKTWPDDRTGRVYGVSSAISELRYLELAFKESQVSENFKDAMVREVFPYLSRFESFTVEYDKEMKPVGVNGKRVEVE